MQNISTEIEKYLMVCKNLKGLSSSSIKAYTIDLKQFEAFMLDKDSLSKNCITEYIDYVYKQFKPKSAKRKIACVKAFYHYMEMENIIETNPFHQIRIRHKEAIVLPKTIPLMCIELILKYAYDQTVLAKSKYQIETTLRNAIVLELLFSTGMRVSEISNLKIKNIDLSTNTIYIFGKGSKERVMCIAEHITKLIKEYLEIRKYCSEYVFTNKLGNNYSEQSIRNMVNEYTKSVGVEMHITPHMFRHTFATALLDEDVDIRYIQQLLGHSSIVTTQIYTHISTNKIRHILEDKHPRNKFAI